ncbi:MAG: cache domain-containing protein [Burkholderiaceae bacterium]
MKYFINAITSAFLALALANNAFAADQKGSADEAVAMVKKAATYLKAHGKEKAFSDFADKSNTQFHDRDLYIFVYDFNGVAVAHGNNPKMVGKNLLEMKDNEGTFIIKEFINVAKTKGKGWVDYKWPNPLTQAIEQKSAYIEKVDGDLIIGSGIYK